MNSASYLTPIFRFGYKILLQTRFIRLKNNCKSFNYNVNKEYNTVERVYVINLDRHNKRWQDVKIELKNIFDATGNPIMSISRRFSAVDARYLTKAPSETELNLSYSLADQLFVDPVRLPNPEREIKNHFIKMSQQETAVALSHLNLWKLIASEEIPYTLILEDDIIFRRRFSKDFDKAWFKLQAIMKETELDILYLSYQEAQRGAKKEQVTNELFRPKFGLWQLSGYILSKKGAKKLLEMLPIQGPVDMWINLQYHKLNVFATKKSIIQQRLDSTSSNSYSVLPILSKMGVLTGERPQIFRKNTLPKPVIAFGENDTGLTSLAMALSILGYRCCSDFEDLPQCETEALFKMSSNRIFDSYVNIGALTPKRLIELAKINNRIHFIITCRFPLNDSISTQKSFNNKNSFKNTETLKRDLLKITPNVLLFPLSEKDEWESLCKFLACDYPSTTYPKEKDRAQRILSKPSKPQFGLNYDKIKLLKGDSLPWIIKNKIWDGIRVESKTQDYLVDTEIVKNTENFSTESTKFWNLRDDTFPSNLSLFRPKNFKRPCEGLGVLTFQRESSSVREYTSASICSKRNYKYGSFEAVIKPAKVSGLITGVFLHRNAPRQEIDIEFLGKDTTKMLVNVFYNPGTDGAKLEYGYRGTPAIIELGFDASDDYHTYVIEWVESSIRWFIDDCLVYERVNWNPTPVPHLPMQFNINLWYSRSKELAGKFRKNKLPACTEIKSFSITSQRINDLEDILDKDQLIANIYSNVEI